MNLNADLDVSYLPNDSFIFIDDAPTAGNITVGIEPCDSNPCKIIKGQTSSIIVHFTPTTEVKALKVKVKAHVGPIWVPYSIDKQDACKDSGLTCPLSAAKEANYEYALKVSTGYPSVSPSSIVGFYASKVRTQPSQDVILTLKQCLKDVYYLGPP